MSKLWGGRFEGSLDKRIDALNRSFPFDCRLAQEDVEGSMAWAHALRRAGVLKTTELRTILKALREISREFSGGTFEEQASDEDIHTAVERRLIELVGDVGRRLHTGRSRNDQVATDFLLWLKRATDEACAGIHAAQIALVHAAERVGSIVIPAYTHLQRAQPVLLAHHLLAYVEMLARDDARLRAMKKRADVLPLGCGAATGTSVAIDRRELARDLGFRGIAQNSLDAVGSRDVALEFLGAATIAMTHLSRLGEEVVLWASAEFGFVELGDNVSTGSSLLPQKRNPDGAELARGKAGRVLGGFVTLATALKGIPLAYNKDLQEDKEAAFDAFDTLAGSCAAMAATVAGLRFREDRCAAALARGHMLAVDVADYLVGKGVPFRTAHERVGLLVREAERRDCDISDLDLEAMRKIAPEIDDDVRRYLTVDAALRRRNAIGGTAPRRVRAQLAKWKRRLDS
ncbi:MAG: argininosuccinate lyase [Planctomycetota bacterium]|jgi:argininosuccinate lyase